MKQLIKVFAFIMFFSSGMGFAQVEETEKAVETMEQKVEEKAEKAEKTYKSADDKRVYDMEKKKHLATKVSAEDKLASMDADKDGKISVEEASNAENKKYSEHFAKIDTNGDGFIDLTELKAKMSKSKDKSKAKLDY